MTHGRNPSQWLSPEPSSIAVDVEGKYDTVLPLLPEKEMYEHYYSLKCYGQTLSPLLLFLLCLHFSWK